MIPDLLRDLQVRFRAAVLDGNTARLAELVRAPGPVADRIDVYRNTVQSSLTDALAAIFPVTQRIVGADYFAGLARRFIAGAPPRRPQLSTYGAALPDFIAASEIHRQLPYLSDVAQLEWARGESYFAADAPPLDSQRLAAMEGEALEDMVLRLHPATRWVVSRFPIYRIWEVNQPHVADVPVVDMQAPQAVLVSRSARHVVTREIALADAVFIQAIAEGETFGGAADTALLQNPTFDLQGALAQHFAHGTFRAANL
jgi:hypothetical protein